MDLQSKFGDQPVLKLEGEVLGKPTWFSLWSLALLSIYELMLSGGHEDTEKKELENSDPH